MDSEEESALEKQHITNELYLANARLTTLEERLERLVTVELLAAEAKSNGATIDDVIARHTMAKFVTPSLSMLKGDIMRECEE